jgi:tetratricopeptide (TPR) repeat protein
MPNSVLCLGNAGARWIDLADTKEITGKLRPGQTVDSYNDYNGTLHITDEEVKAGGYKDKRETALNKGIKFLKHAVELHPRYVNGYLNLGLGSFKLGNTRDALFYWKHAENLYPNNPYLASYYQVFYNDLLNKGYQMSQRGQLDSAIYILRHTMLLVKNNPEGYYNLGSAYYQKKQYDKAKYYWEECLKINPAHVQAKAGLSTIIIVPASVSVAKK